MNNSVFYMPHQRIKEFKKIIKKCKICNVDDINIIPNGVIKAFDSKTHTLGVFNHKYKPIKSAEVRYDNILLFRQKFCRRNKKASDIPYINTDVIYLGQTPNHFGHFLINSMDRAWIAVNPKFANAKFAFVDFYSKNESYYKILEKLLGPDSVIFIKQNTRFKNIIVPQRSFKHKEYISPQYKETFDKIAQQIDSKFKYEKIYVSRCQFVNTNNPNNTFFGEKQIEQIFRNNGYHIIYPEQLDISEQIAYMKNCRFLAGIAGTALHLAVFMPNGGTVIQINRSKSSFAFAQYQINSIKNHRGIYIDASIEKHKTCHSVSVPQIVGVTNFLKQFFNDFQLKYTPEDIKFNKIEYQKYLTACNKFSRLKFIQSRKMKLFIKRFIHIACWFIPIRSWRHKLRDIM